MSRFCAAIKDGSCGCTCFPAPVYSVSCTKIECRQRHGAFAVRETGVRYDLLGGRRNGIERFAVVTKTPPVLGNIPELASVVRAGGQEDHRRSDLELFLGFDFECGNRALTDVSPRAVSIRHGTELVSDGKLNCVLADDAVRVQVLDDLTFARVAATKTPLTCLLLDYHFATVGAAMRIWLSSCKEFPYTAGRCRAGFTAIAFALPRDTEKIHKEILRCASGTGLIAIEDSLISKY